MVQPLMWLRPLETNLTYTFLAASIGAALFCCCNPKNTYNENSFCKEALLHTYKSI